MFDNIGGKLKGLAIACLVLFPIDGFIAFIAMAATSSSLSGMGFGVFVSAVFLGIAAAWGLYSWGEVVDDVEKIKNNSILICQKLDKLIGNETKQISSTQETTDVEKQKEESKSGKEIYLDGDGIYKYLKEYCAKEDKETFLCGESKSAELVQIAGGRNELFKALIKLENGGFIACENTDKLPIGFITILK